MKLIEQKSEPLWTVERFTGNGYVRVRNHRLTFHEAISELRLGAIHEVLGCRNLSEYGGVPAGFLRVLNINATREVDHFTIDVIIQQSTISYGEPIRVLIVETGEVKEIDRPLYPAAEFRDAFPSARPFPEAEGDSLCGFQSELTSVL